MYKVNLLRKDGSTECCECLTVEEYMQKVDRHTLLQDIKLRQARAGREREYWYNKPITFDIETSQIEIDAKNREYFNPMYIWQMTIDGVVIIGRYWEEWIKVLSFLKEALLTNSDRRAIIWVHNLPYEWQWIHSRLPIKSVFARETRKPMKVLLGGLLEGIEFRCTYALTGKSLEKWASDIDRCPYQKLKGNLDYSVIRTPETILTNEELAYCVQDVLTMHHCLLDCIEMEHSKCIADIPMTKTGYVRRECRNYLRGDNQYRKFYHNMKLDAYQFVKYNMAYRGGDTHANSIHCQDVLDKVFSFDIASSYPYRIVAEDFPLSAPLTLKNPTIKELNFLMKEKMLFIIDITLCNVKLRNLDCFTYIQSSDCSSKGAKLDNGRIYEAERLRIVVTSIDFEIMMYNYEFEIEQIDTIIYHTKKGLLPKKFREFTINCYKDKTTLKGVEGRDTDYRLSKERLNSLYGMCVTNPLNDEIEFDISGKEWIKTQIEIKHGNEDKIQEQLDRVYKSRNHFLAYEVGVWISAYARYDLHRAMHKMGSDTVYWDTDCTKFINEENRSIFDGLNSDKEKRLIECGYSIEEYAPKDIKGNRHTIGFWEEESEFFGGSKFITFGSKKYFFKDQKGQNHITVAGLNKSKAKNYLEKILDNDVTNIKLGQVIPEEYSGRTGSVFSETPLEMEYNGVWMYEKSWMSIIPTTYCLSDVEEHKLYILLTKRIKTKAR